MKKILPLFSLLLIICNEKAVSQDIHFSQYYNTPLLVNPAQAGSFENYQAIINYRDQWSAVSENPYRTYAGSFDMKISKEKSSSGYIGAGITIFSDKSGDGKMGTNQGNLYLSGGVKLNPKNTLSVGIQGGFAQRQVDMDAFTWDNQFDGTHYNATVDPGEKNRDNNFLLPETGGGILWNYDKGEETYATNNNTLKVNLGFSVSHLNRPKYSFFDNGNEKQSMKIIIHSSTAVGIKNSNGTVVPSLIYTKQGSQQETIVGAAYKFAIKNNSKYTGYVKSSSVIVGLYHRWHDAMVTRLEYEASSYAIGINYDLNVSKLRTASNLRGGFEVSLRFFSSKEKTMVSPKL